MTDVSDSVREFLLALADDKHLMGQQHAEWIGVAPFLEEDLAFCSIGQDELGHAALLYELLVGDDDLAIDKLAFGRGADAYRSSWLTEMPMPEWSEALVRHWMFDHADRLRWSLLAESSLTPLGDIAARVEREEQFHRRHADSLLDVLLADATAEATIGVAVNKVAPLALGLFEPCAGEAEVVAAGVATAPFASKLGEWQQLTEDRFGTVVWGDAPPQNARTTRSTAFQPLMDRMREVLDLDPDAVW